MDTNKDQDLNYKEFSLEASTEDDVINNDLNCSCEAEDQTDLKTEIIDETSQLKDPYSFYQIDVFPISEVGKKSNVDYEVEKYQAIEYAGNADNNRDECLSSILSDHNYTSKNITQTKYNCRNLKQLLIQHILPEQSSKKEHIPPNVSGFVDDLLTSIETFQLDSSNLNQCNKIVKDELQGNEKQAVKSVLSSENHNIGEGYFDGTRKTQSPLTLPENCSEPMEFLPCNELFEACNEQESETKNILKKTMHFAKTLYNECNSFASSSTDIESKFKIYLKEQINNLRSIVSTEQFVEKQVQTDFHKPNKKKKQCNFEARQKLLETSSSYSSSSESSDESMDTPRKNKSDSNFTTSKHPISDVVSEGTSKITASCSIQDSDDGIDLSNYIQSDIFEPEYLKSSSSRNESDKENSQGKKNFSSDDDTDKEIERLTNLSCLSKRKINIGSKQLDNEKKNGKLLNQKSEKKVLNFCEDYLENETSGESIFQSEDEIVTEREYITRYNQQIKKDLLDDSSSDSSESLDCNADLSISNEETCEDKPLLVEKFLEAFDVNDSEDNEELNKGIGPNSTDENEKENIKLGTCVASPDSSDCEVLNDNLIQKKRGNKKTLEKMMLEADKRNYGNDEIVLSSESDYSDVETIDVEPTEEKSRIIKPMLRPDQLANETRKAQKMETDRIRKLEKQNAALEKAKKHHSQNIKSSDLILDYIESTKTFIKVDPEIVKELKPHQIDGVKFMYESCYAGIDLSKKTTGSGCILAHCMGLGKTLQLIALIYTVVTYEELSTSKVLVLCPKSTVMNWAEELQRWLGPLKKKKHLKVFDFAETSDIKDKLNILEEWSSSTSKNPGCLLLGYEAFRTLVFYRSYKNRGKIQNPKLLEDIKEKVIKFLLKPGADLVVCDEGHIIKNSKSAISLAVAKIGTPKRIILTGTPIQNNLKEYYSMVNFIKPLYLGTEKEFANLYANPIKNGQHKDSSKKDIKVMKQRSFVLHKKLSKFVQRKEAELLKTFLPPKYEYVLFIPMTLVQNKLYEYIVEAIATRGDNRGKSLITDYTCLRKIWTHPKVLQDAWQNAINQKNKIESRKNSLAHSDDDQPDDIYDSQTGVMSVTNDWWKNLLEKKDLETITPSNKLRAMFEILRMCEEKGEKCLVFSAFVAVLNVVEYFFKKITNKDPDVLQQTGCFSNQKISNVWILGQDYYRLDGKTPKTIRHEMIKRFNSTTNKRARVFLISSKAGGQGINLTGANRAIILDTSWNPSNDQQNIFRIFRLGQKKNCYIYRLLAMGTMEEKVYTRSVTKQAMSFRVVDEQQIDRHYNMAELAELYTLTIPKSSERPMPIVPKDNILATLLLNHPDVVYKYHEHDSLLENKVEQELSEQEKADAWAAYERELHTNLEQESLSSEKIPNSFLMSRMNNFMGAPSGLDMQALLNCGMLNPQQSTGISPYSFTNQYLDALNMYRNLPMSFPDINNPVHDSVFNSSLYNVPSSMPIMSSIHGSGVAASNPLAALSEFNVFNMGGQKNFAGSNKTPVTIPTVQPSLLTNFGTSSLVSNPLNNTNLLPNYDQYKQRIDNTFANYLNYAANNYSTTPPVSSLLGGQHSTPTQKPTNMTLDTLSPTGNILIQAKDAEKVLKDDSVSKSQFLSKKNDPIQKNISKNFPPSQLHMHRNSDLHVEKTPSPTRMPVMGQIIATPQQTSQSATCHAVQKTRKTTNGGNTSTKNGYNTTNVANMGIVYPNYKGTPASNEHLKSTNEMQIIPTTSPPGTSSISKQLNELSPSISVTAVRKSDRNNTSSQLNSKQKFMNMQNNQIVSNAVTFSDSSKISSAEPKSAAFQVPSTSTLITQQDAMNSGISSKDAIREPQSRKTESAKFSSTPANTKSLNSNSLTNEELLQNAGLLEGSRDNNVRKIQNIKSAQKPGLKSTSSVNAALPNLLTQVLKSIGESQFEINKRFSNINENHKNITGTSPITSQPKPSGTGQYMDKMPSVNTDSKGELLTKISKIPLDRKRKSEDPKHPTESKRINI